MSQPIGLYIHVPFCAGKCPYCDFYSLVGADDTADSYTGAVLRTISQYRALLLNRRVDSLYFGGGTPSRLQAEQLCRIIRFVRPFLTANAEITVECNPADYLETLLPALAAADLNRISLGMQSAVDNERRALGRRADRERLWEVLSLCRQNGIENISLDLMLGIPGMTEESLKESLRFVADAKVPHLSAYLLKIEPGTPFASMERQLALPEEDEVCDQYLYAVARLKEMGLPQYEISNFARPGFESQHNLKYWQCKEYLGIGPSAHSYLDGKRFYYPRDLSAFLNGQPPVPDGNGGSLAERLMLGLRLSCGVSPSLLTPEAQKKAVLYIKHGLMYTTPQGYVAMTPQGFLLSNSIICELIKKDG